MKTSIIIQARMESTRLWGKVLLPVRVLDRTVPILQAMIQRLKTVHDSIVIASPFSPYSEIIENSIFGVDFYYGEMDDLISRTLNAALFTNTDTIIDITSDCPLVDPDHTVLLHDIYKSSNLDYITNAALRSWPDGCDIQIYSTESLKKLSKLITNKQYRTHSGWNFINFPKDFKQKNIPAPKAYHLPDLGLTLDTKEDYLLLSKIYWILSEQYGEDPTKVRIEKIIDIVKSREDLLNINRKVKRKKPGVEL